MSSTAPTTLFVVPCSAEKHLLVEGAKLKAESLYRGQAFTMLRNRLKVAGAAWCVFSARYGFLWPSTPIEWYDQKLTESDVREIEAGTADWVPFDALTNRQYAKLCTARTVVTLGSKLYARAVEGLLEKYAPRRPENRAYAAPFAGLPIGRMLEAIKKENWWHRCPMCARPYHDPHHVCPDCNDAVMGGTWRPAGNYRCTKQGPLGILP